MAETRDKLILGYWGVQAFAHPTRWLLAYHNIPFEDKFYMEPSQWFDVDKPALKSDFPNLPYIQDGDTVITESVAVIQYAAYKTGNKDLFGKNTLDAIKIAQLNSFLGDLFQTYRTLLLNKDYEKERDGYLNDKVAPFLNKLSKNLGEKEFAIEYLTWVDFILFNAIDISHRISSEFLAKWPNLVKFHQRINNNEGVKAYRSSKNYPKYFGPPDRLACALEEK